MNSFLKGAIIGLLGLVVWLVASLIEGIIQGLSYESTWIVWLVYLGFFTMIGGPAYYWAIQPIWKRIRSRKPKAT